MMQSEKMPATFTLNHLKKMSGLDSESMEV